ncbi:TPA: hypothetical protein DEQ89_01935 [Candidatus Daviesbacteria bacterium]|nr:hypothetical protein [Candidatus Daviesbacteria bacterium]HLC62652.1 hypothetical protein [Candidatus Nanoarchaeia archaeon]
MAHEKLVKEGEEAIKKGIKPAEVEDYFKKKGMDKKEAKEEITKLQASRIVEEHKKAQKAAAQVQPNQAKSSPTQTEKKSSFGFWLIILLIIGIIIYLFYAGFISTDIFRNMNFKLPSFSK